MPSFTTHAYNSTAPTPSLVSCRLPLGCRARALTPGLVSCPCLPGMCAAEMEASVGSWDEEELWAGA
jgi:hypothetical protein